ncbi:3,4-dihydroxy-2-butanone 4-phosphate synthase [Methanocella paludicola SANAE]|uniref:3,4-dihydroxy-2-butanone 4-phosphate synthase n=1 Tax=Methanocella paludicola (strain DSM 17711 / JCM 13418 / NBRC 101707 / SANAE) TaxID=304371 RepID=D1Z220_METPS|nr:3,4-dihydroxy-2-butanone-4-phosphate synthase [Methanocella paludicola]BAI62742.1 3,4-dihydroxy-2-butanone 4-phosphate synthase [Methanocella paludicola SANAE]
MIQEAIKALQDGQPILLYDFDDRETETDIVIPAEHTTPKEVYRLRRDAGGLICTAIDPIICDRIGIPYIVDVLRFAGNSGNGFKAIESIYERVGDIPYDAKSSFSLWVNHRKTFTGITDNDRSLTITKLGEITKKAMNGNKVNFGAEFRSPGHMPLLRAAPGLLKDRRGQTELSIVLARAANITPAMVMCEMLDGETGKALKKQDAIAYGKKHGLVFIEGKEVVDYFNREMAKVIASSNGKVPQSTT